jgi:type IV pilus assembly protein PilY1
MNSNNIKLLMNKYSYIKQPYERKLMFNSFNKKLFYFIACISLTISSGSAYADDTEIFFSSGSATGNQALVRPNVLLILDTSGSMSATVAGTNPAQSRIEVMKEAMVKIINGMEDVNVGLMRFTYKNGGAIVYPITYIDDNNASTVSEPDDTRQTYTYTIDASSNDAEQAGTVVDIDDAILNIHTLQGGGASVVDQVGTSDNDADQIGSTVSTTNPFFNDGALQAARFTGLSIPVGSTIISASLALTRRTNIDAGDSTIISGEKISNCVDYSSPGVNELSTRKAASPTTATAAKTFGVSDPETIDVTTIIRELTYGGGAVTATNNAGVAGNPLCLFSDSTGNGTFHSFDTSSGDAPKLTVNYTAPGANTVQESGLRFSKVEIPQGTTIISAKLTFTGSSTDTSTKPNWVIEGELATNSATFDAATASGISGRTHSAASVNFTAPNTTADTNFDTNDIKTVVQEIVNQAGWCGGSPMTFFITENGGPTGDTRTLHSYDSNPSFAPQLEVTFDNATATGCYEAVETAQISGKYDDAEEVATGSSKFSMNLTSSDLDIGGKNVGLRFTDIDIPNGATIINASLTFEASGTTTSGNPSFTINGELPADGDADIFSSTDKNITDRIKTTKSATWGPFDFNFNHEIETTSTTTNLNEIVEEIVGDTNWSSGNSLAFIIASGGNNRPADSRDHNAARGARLSVTYQATGTSSVKTVRQKLIEVVNNFPIPDWTPIVEVLHEAALYWRGDDSNYGRFRDGISQTRLSHPATYCTAAGNCGAADTAGNPSFGATFPGTCTDANLNNSDCRTRRITNAPEYISPFSSTLTCQSNYQVLLTDGEANSNNLTSSGSISYLSSACATSGTNRGTFSSGEKCGVDIVEYMNQNDQSSSLTNEQTVTTYTVGFNTGNNATNYLKDLAEAGNGEFFEASTSDDLVNVFTEILTDVKSDPTSFVAPSLATNAFNRLLSRDEVYFGLFTPDLNTRWLGNLKKYKVCIDSTTGCSLGAILDATDTDAINSSTNKFSTTAQSIWSDAVDGLTTTSGGAGAEMIDYSSITVGRTIYTETTTGTDPGAAPSNGTSLGAADYKLTEATWDSAEMADVRTRACTTPSTTAGSACEDTMLWLLGKNVISADSDTDTSTNTRWTVNDVLHSSPQVITYGGSDTSSPADGTIDTFFDKLVLGTNEGGLRMVNGSTGLEEWTFLPQEFISNTETLFNNAEGDHTYGLDSTVTVRQLDSDFDGSIETGDGDFVKIYSAMRRGGNNIYALDVSANLSSASDAVVPKFMFRIEGGSGDFSRMGQTWSQPRTATINTTSGSTVSSKDVLIFGGGYTPGLDSGFGTTATASADNIGNAVYIVDADTGAKILSISGSSTSADIEVPDMHFSIPGRITIIDTDNDGIDDRLYFSDTGGQVWRVDLADDIKLSGQIAGSTVVGRLAAISTDDGVTTTNSADERRFFEPPAVVQVLDSIYSDTSEYDYVFIGSGNRPNPLGANIQDRFYGFRDRNISGMEDSSPQDNIADSYPNTTGTATPYTASTLVDVTSTVLDTSAATKSSDGWFFDFTSSGTSDEKVLSAASVIAGNVFFTTFEPDATLSADLCSTNIGGGNAYGFNILTTNAALDWDGDGDIDQADRKLALGGGIPSDVVPIFTKEGVVGIVGIEGGAAQLGVLSELPRVRTYWYEDL